MKKVFIVLLIAAIGAVVYFYFSRKPKTSIANSKELIIGKWKVDSLISKKDTTTFGKLFSHLFDSHIYKYRVEFTKDNAVFTSNDEKVDTGRYELVDKNTLLISRDASSGKERWNIGRLDSSVLSARDKDSSVLYLRRLTNE